MSEVSRICADLDEELTAFRDRPLREVAFAYVFLDATYGKPGVNRRVVSQADVIATGVAAEGTVKCSASRWGTAKTARSGRRSCARSRP